MKEQFNYPVRLEFVVTLSAHQLSTDLRVRNVAQATHPPMEFQALFHNYIRAPADDVRITPLTGLSYYDKTESTEEARATSKVESRCKFAARRRAHVVLRQSAWRCPSMATTFFSCHFYAIFSH